MPAVVPLVAAIAGAWAGAALGGGLAGALVGGIVTAGINMALSKKPKMGDLSSASQDIRGFTSNVSPSIAPLPILYGATRIAGARVFAETSGDKNEYLHLVIAWCEGEINAVDTIYFDGIPETDARFTGLIDYGDGKSAHLGADDQVADSQLVARLPTSWTSDHRLRGVAYTYLRLKYKPEAFPNVPVVTADLQGLKVKNVATGVVGYSNNPADCIYDYLTDTRYGRGIPESEIDLASFQTARTVCNVLEADPDGDQARYTCDGALSPDAASLDNLRDLLSACRGYLVFSSGSYRLIVDAAEASTLTLTENEIVGNWQIALDSKESRFNRVRARFFNATRNHEEDICIQDSAGYRAADNGTLLESEITLPMVSNYYRAMRIAGLELEQSRLGMVVTFTTTLYGLRCEVGDVLSITHSVPGWTLKKFRVLGIEIDSVDTLTITAREYGEIYTPGFLNTEPTPPVPVLPPVNDIEDLIEIPEIEASVTWIETFESGDMVGWSASGGVDYVASADALVGSLAGKFTLTSGGGMDYAYFIVPASFTYAALVPGRRVRVQFWYKADPANPSSHARVGWWGTSTSQELDIYPTSSWQQGGFLVPTPSAQATYFLFYVRPDYLGINKGILLDNIVAFVVPDVIDAASIDQWIGTAAIGEAYIADLAVTQAKIAELAVTQAKIADLSVTTGKIADLNVTTLKVAGNAITASANSKNEITNLYAEGTNNYRCSITLYGVESAQPIQLLAYQRVAFSSKWPTVYTRIYDTGYNLVFDSGPTLNDFITTSTIVSGYTGDVTFHLYITLADDDGYIAYSSLIGTLLKK